MYKKFLSQCLAQRRGSGRPFKVRAPGMYGPQIQSTFEVGPQSQGTAAEEEMKYASSQGMCWARSPDEQVLQQD